MMIDKENEHEQEIVEMRRQIAIERKKSKDLQASSKEVKENYDKLQADIFDQVKEKDRKLSLLNTTVRDLQNQLSQVQSCAQT